MNPKGLEVIINEKLGRLQRCLTENDLVSANFWMERFKEDIILYGKMLPKSVIQDYSKLYNFFKNRIENMYLGVIDVRKDN